jgi:DNA-binding NarL/FixJ family response regulator
LRDEPWFSLKEVSMSVPRNSILIADDHLLLAELCKSLLEVEFNVVGVVRNGHQLVRSAAELKPDVIVIDIAMPILNGLDAGERVKEMLPDVKLVYLTMNSDPELAAEAMLRGASGYLLKTCAASELVVAVRAVLRGKSYMCSALSKENVNCLIWERKHAVSRDEKLTPRQCEVLQLLAEGKVMKEVGDILNMSTRTVAFHKYRIMDALGAKSNAELVRYAVKSHMVST